MIESRDEVSVAENEPMREDDPVAGRVAASLNDADDRRRTLVAHPTGGLRVEVLTPTGDVALLVEDKFLSGWIAASFSDDGRLLVVASPNSLTVLRR